MKIISIQVGKPKEVTYRGRVVSTGIFKSPIAGRVKVNALNLEGDGQADLSVHGGVDKAVYAYSLDWSDWWTKERPGVSFDGGAFGENLSLRGMDENQVFLGDTFAVGDAVLQAIQPRFPCFKLGIKFDDPSIIKSFMKAGRPGVYFRVLQEGFIEPGQEFKLLSSEKEKVSITRIFTMFRDRDADPVEIAQLKNISYFPRELLDQIVHLNSLSS